MKHLLLTLVFVCCISAFARAQQTNHQMKMEVGEPRAELVAGMGSHHHRVFTGKPEAQKFFDQGISFIFAFNHDEAIRSFKRAAEIDPEMTMAYWGIGLALGPNINLDVDPERERAAYEATQKALLLAAKAPDNERAYVDALAKRYSIDAKADLKKLALDYKNAMGELLKNYPDDGMAYEAKGRATEAEREYAALIETERAIPADASFNLNSAGKILKLAEYVLAARLAKMKTGDDKTAIELLRKAVELEDSLAYDEPPGWFLPVRIWLGGSLMSGHDYAGAEQVFRADLERNRRNGRSLFGLMECLKAQKKSYAASLVQREFQEAWKNADTPLRLEDLQR